MLPGPSTAFSRFRDSPTACLSPYTWPLPSFLHSCNRPPPVLPGGLHCHSAAPCSGAYTAMSRKNARWKQLVISLCIDIIPIPPPLEFDNIPVPQSRTNSNDYCVAKVTPEHFVANEIFTIPKHDKVPVIVVTECILFSVGELLNLSAFRWIRRPLTEDRRRV
jgi:hypothetical protein